MQIKKILICEDDKDIVFFLKIFFKKKNYDFIMLEEGKKVIPTIKENDIGVILLDLGLPDIDGAVIAEELKKNEETRHIPIILFSAGSRVKEVAEKVGADAYIKKPFNLDELEAVIKEKLAGF
jgi:DNA-binding response OmpR family regulator